jgi:DMSO/TMAO reductase YedYZ heme-binding membrane subunit
MTDNCFTDTKKLKSIKILIIALIVITSILPALFIQLNENDASLNTYKLFAKVGSLIATVLFTWQFILGFSQALSYIIKDLIWTVNLHKNLGRFACVLIFLHPIFITFYYLEKENKNLFSFVLSSPFDYYVLLGMITLLIMLIVFITSTALRRRLSFDQWYSWHLISYLMLPLAIVHSFPIGSTIQNTPAKIIWYILTAVIIVFYIYRIACRLCLLSRPYKVIKTQKVADSTTEITMSPLKKPIIPQLSYFIYIRRGFWKIARPYTVSDYDQQNNNLSITAKALGKTSSDLQNNPPRTIPYPISFDFRYNYG